MYGDAERFPTKETALPRPVSPYGVTKLAAEHLTNLYMRNFGLPAVSVRYFTVYGPRQRPDMAFARFMQAMTASEDIEVFGDCDPVYIDFPGWKTPTNRCRSWKELPLKARAYLKAIADLTGAKLSIVSIGPARDQTIAV